MSENLPEFRFDNFNIALQKYSLSEITERVKSYSLSRDVETKEVTGYKYIHYGDIHRKIANIIEQKSEIPNIKPGDYELLKQGDIVVADASEDYQGIATPSIVDFKTTYKLVSGLHTIALRPIKSDPMYTYYLFNSQKFRKYGYRVGTGMKVFGISLSNLMKFESYFPSISEQHRIGIFLRKVDNTIVLQQQLLDDYKQLKKAMLQKMFPQKGESVPRLRFAGFTDNWEQRKLGDLDTFFTDGNYGEAYPSRSDMTDQKNGIPFLRGNNLIEGKLSILNSNYIKEEKHKELTSGHLKFDDVVIAVRGSVGSIGYVNKENEGWNINSQLAILRTNKSEVKGNFLIQFLISDYGRKELNSRITGTALKQLPMKQLKDVPVPKLNILEQEKIGDFFKRLDETIALHEKKLETYKDLKNAMLQKMFV